MSDIFQNRSWQKRKGTLAADFGRVYHTWQFALCAIGTKVFVISIDVLALSVIFISQFALHHLLSKALPSYHISLWFAAQTVKNSFLIAWFFHFALSMYNLSMYGPSSRIRRFPCGCFTIFDVRWEALVFHSLWSLTFIFRVGWCILRSFSLHPSPVRYFAI